MHPGWQSEALELDPVPKPPGGLGSAPQPPMGPPLGPPPPIGEPPNCLFVNGVAAWQRACQGLSRTGSKTSETPLGRRFDSERQSNRKRFDRNSDVTVMARTDMRQ